MFSGVHYTSLPLALVNEAIFLTELSYLAAPQSQGSEPSPAMISVIREESNAQGNSLKSAESRILTQNNLV
jgi:hypothetical protein